MEVCNCHTRNMSFLDEIFGTDGRKHKDEGIWNWVKNQRNKRKHKKAEQQLLQQQQQQQQSAALHLHNHHASAVPSQNTYSSASNNTEFNNTHTRSHSVSSAATSTTLYYCSPRSPTSTFTPSTAAASSPPSTGYSSPRDSLYFRRPASVNSYTSTATSPSTLLDGSDSSPKTYRLPYTHSRQRAQSTFTLPAPGATGTTVDSTKRYVSSRQQRPQYYYADDYSHNHTQNHNLHSHHVHEFYDDEEGPIRRSASSRSAPTHYSYSRPQPSQQQDERQQEEEGDSLNLCDIDSRSLSASSSNSSSSSSGCSNKGKGVQRDQEETMGDITEVENDDDENDEYSVVMDSNLSLSSNINNHPLRRAATVTADGSHGNGGVSLVAPVARRRRSESTNSFHHKQEDGWWWE